MVWRGLLFVVLVLGLVGCGADGYERTHVDIDWVHFVQWDGVTYVALYDEVMTDESFVGDSFGEVLHRLDGNVTDTNYRSKDGDAAYLDEGTKLYHVLGEPDLLVAKEDWDVRSYRLFAREDYEEMTFAEAAKRVVAVEVWEMSDTSVVERFVIDDITPLVAELQDANVLVRDWDVTEDDRYYTFVFVTEDVLSFRLNVQYSDDIWYVAIDGEWVVVSLDEWFE